MTEINTTENLRRWFMDCPLLDKNKPFGVDYLGSDQVQYAIFTDQSELRYIKHIRKPPALEPSQSINFVFAVRVPYSKETMQNIQNKGLFDGVIAWMHEQTTNRTLPEIAEGTAISILAQSTSFVLETNEDDSAVYQMQCALIYRV